jgi:hypothetical protein
MTPLVRFFILLGILFLLSGGLLFLFGKFNLPLGHLPGDIRIEWKNGVFYFPLATCILVSLLLSGMLAFITRFWKK